MLRWGFLKKADPEESSAPPAAPRPEGDDDWAYLRARPDFDSEEMAAVHSRSTVGNRAGEASLGDGALLPDPELEARLSRDLEELQPQFLNELLDAPHEDASGQPGEANLGPPAPVRQPLALDVRSGVRRMLRTVDEALLIGRLDLESGCHPEVDLSQDDAVSRRHARIWLKAGVYHLQDLGSTNGTLHNGRWLASGETVELRAGDVIQLGDVSVIHVVPVGVVRQPSQNEKEERVIAESLDELFGGSFVTTRMDPRAPAPPLLADGSGKDVLDLALDLGREDGIL